MDKDVKGGGKIDWGTKKELSPMYKKERPEKPWERPDRPFLRRKEAVSSDFSYPGSDTAASSVKEKPEEAVNHPAHYGGVDDPYEAIKVIEAWNLGFCLGNTIKYISRAGRKDKSKIVEDLRKAAWYLNREIERIDGRKAPSEA